MFRRSMNGFRKLTAWQEAHRLTVMIYQITAAFPKHELYGITNQLRRASYSVETQLAEGSRMPTRAHQLAFYHRAYGSCAEIDNFLELSIDLQYLSEDDYKKLLAQLNRTSFIVKRLVESLTRPTKLTKPTEPKGFKVPNYTNFS